jgi:hypothetical protein
MAAGGLLRCERAGATLRCGLGASLSADETRRISRDEAPLFRARRPPSFDFPQIQRNSPRYCASTNSLEPL